MSKVRAWVWLAGLAVFGPGLAVSQPRIPSKVTFRYVAGQALKPLLLRGNDGRIFELSIEDLKNYGSLTLFRPHHKSSATNLLEPKGHWHGAEPFDIDCKNPDRPSVFGPHRDMPVRNYHFILHMDVIRFECADSDDIDGASYKNFELNLELRPSP